MTKEQTDKACDELGDLLSDIGWRPANDAQWTGLLEALPRIKNILDSIKTDSGEVVGNVWRRDTGAIVILSKEEADSLANGTLLYTHAEKPAAGSVPDGWQLVPINPTQEMILAGQDRYTAGNTYRTMLSAAPKPSEPTSKEISPLTCDADSSVVEEIDKHFGRANLSNPHG